MPVQHGFLARGVAVRSEAEFLSQQALSFFFSLLHLHCSLTSLCFQDSLQNLTFLLSQDLHLALLLSCTVAPYLPWHTSCSGCTPFSCPKTFCLSFAPCLFPWSLFPILFPWPVTSNPNNVPAVLSSSKAVSSSPCVPSEAGFLLCSRSSPFFPPQRALYTSSLFPSCPAGKSFCAHTIFLSEGFPLSCLYQGLCAFFQHPLLILTVRETSQLVTWGAGGEGTGMKRWKMLVSAPGCTVWFIKQLQNCSKLHEKLNSLSLPPPFSLYDFVAISVPSYWCPKHCLQFWKQANAWFKSCHSVSPKKKKCYQLQFKTSVNRDNYLWCL